MIPVDAIQPTDSFPPYEIKISSFDELMVGSDHGLDVICNGIMNNTSFVYPSEIFKVNNNRIK